MAATETGKAMISKVVAAATLWLLAGAIEFNVNDFPKTSESDRVRAEKMKKAVGKYQGKQVVGVLTLDSVYSIGNRRRVYRVEGRDFLLKAEFHLDMGKEFPKKVEFIGTLKFSGFSATIQVEKWSPAK